MKQIAHPFPLRSGWAFLIPVETTKEAWFAVPAIHRLD